MNKLGGPRPPQSPPWRPQPFILAPAVEMQILPISCYFDHYNCLVAVTFCYFTILHLPCAFLNLCSAFCLCLLSFLLPLSSASAFCLCLLPFAVHLCLPPLPSPFAFCHLPSTFAFHIIHTPRPFVFSFCLSLQSWSCALALSLYLHLHFMFLSCFFLSVFACYLSRRPFSFCLYKPHFPYAPSLCIFPRLPCVFLVPLIRPLSCYFAPSFYLLLCFMFGFRLSLLPLPSAFSFTFFFCLFILPL